MNEKIQEALEELLAWTPSEAPLQFTAKYNPLNFGRKVKDWSVTQSLLDIEQASPFLSEAYLYNLLGKEDARALLLRLRKLQEAVAAATKEDLKAAS